MSNEPTEYTTGGNGKATDHSGTDAAARIAHNFIDKIAKIAEQSEQRIRNASEDAEKSLKQSLDTARNKSAVVKDSVGDFVQQHPMAALGIAFGVGVLLSYLTQSGGRAARESERHDDSA